MAGEAGTLEVLARQAGLALQPLQTTLTPSGIIPLLAELGLQFPAALTAQSGFMQKVSAGGSAAGQLSTLIAQLATDIDNGDDAAIAADGVKLIQQIANVVSALDAIGQELGGLGSLPGITGAELSDFAGKLTQSLLSYLVISYIENAQPGVVGIANLLCILDYLPNSELPGDPTHPPYTSRQLTLGNLGQLLSSPGQLLSAVTGWGAPGFDGGKLVPRLASSLELLGLDTIATGSDAGNAITTSLLSIQANASGLAATLNYPIPGGFNVAIPLSALWSLNIQTVGDLNAGVTAAITPPASVALKPPGGPLSGSLQMNLVATPPGADDPIVIFGQTGGSVLQAASFSFGAGANLNWDSSSATATLDPSIQAAITGGKLVIDMSEADGFLADVTSGTPIQASFGFAATWAPDTGLHITGGAQLEIDLPMHLDLGPVTIQTIYVIGGLQGGGLALELAAALGVTLGPIQASVDRVGLSGTLSFPQGGGNLGSGRPRTRLQTPRWPRP